MNLKAGAGSGSEISVNLFLTMLLKIKKGATKEEILKALEKMQEQRDKGKLTRFFGKMKGIFTDGVDYQREIRNEW